MKLNSLLKYLDPQPSVASLQIAESALRFTLISGASPSFVSLKLPDEIIEEGKIKNKNELKSALIKLHSQIVPRAKKKIYVVLNIPENNVYVQVFNLPLASVENLEEAIKLNLQMISPIDFKSAYYDWQQVGENANGGGQLEILGAFASAKVIDEFVECLAAANFTAVAVEFPSLAISRLACGIQDLPPAFLLLHLSAGGLDFAMIKNYNLYFSHFIPWPAIKERRIPLNAVREILIKETRNLLNFACNRWQDIKIDTLLLATPTLDEKLSQIIKENFSLSIKKMVLPSELKSPKGDWFLESKQLRVLTSDWFIALGSALRGAMNRLRDIIISLAKTGTEEEFRQQKIITFVNTWRNAVLTCFSAVLIAFLLVDGFLAKTASSLNNQIVNLVDFAGQEEVIGLQKEADSFNAKVSVALQAREQSSAWSPFLTEIKNLAGTDIAIQRIFIQSLEPSNFSVLFSGATSDDRAILVFKDKLSKDSQFSEINFPVSSVSQSADGKLNFNIMFKLKTQVQNSDGQ